jgi:FkbM family methyltransferase
MPSRRRRLAKAARGWLRGRGFDIRHYPNPLATVEEHLSYLLTRLRVDCVLDVGAHHGMYGRELRALGYTGKIVSFEPVAANVEELRKHLDAHWTVLQQGVGNESGEKTIHLTKGSQQHSFLEPSDYATQIAPGVFSEVSSEKVEIVRLDDVLGQLVEPGARVFVKIDAQGFDLDVLRGAEKSLEQVVGIQIELAFRQTYDGQPDYLELLAWLRDHGFEPTGVFPFYYDPRSWLAIEAECFLKRAEG